MFLPVKDAEFNDSILSASPSEPVMEHSDNKDDAPKQKKDKKGVPLWQINVMYEHAQDFAPEIATVKIKSAIDPNIVAGPIRFGGLAFRTWDMGGKKGLSIAADTFTQETATPVKTSAPPKPPTTDKK